MDALIEKAFDISLYLHRVGIRLKMEGNESVKESSSKLPWHVHGLNRVEKLLLITILTNNVLSLVVGLVAQGGVQGQGLHVETRKAIHVRDYDFGLD